MLKREHEPRPQGEMFFPLAGGAGAAARALKESLAVAPGTDTGRGGRDRKWGHGGALFSNYLSSTAARLAASGKMTSASMTGTLAGWPKLRV